MGDRYACLVCGSAVGAHARRVELHPYGQFTSLTVGYACSVKHAKKAAKRGKKAKRGRVGFVELATPAVIGAYGYE